MRLSLWTLLSIGLFSSQMVRADDAFTASCSRVIRALQTNDWNAFRQEAADQVVFEKIDRIYLQDPHPASTAKWLAGSPGWIKGDYVNDNETEPIDGNDRHFSLTHVVSMSRRPSRDERRAFAKFCGFMQRSYGPILRGRNLRGTEDQSLFGPAIEGKDTSNFKWRVQLELVNDRWRVRKLISEAH